MAELIVAPTPEIQSDWRYQAIVLRLVDVLRGERVNIGVLLAGEDHLRRERHFLYRCADDLSRALFLLPGFRSQQEYLEELIQFDEGLARLRAMERPPRSILNIAAELLPHDDSGLQWSQQNPPMFGVCGSGIEALQLRLDSLFDRLIADPRDKPATERAKLPGEPYRLAVDFDGVLNSYASGWTGPADLPDPPVAGAIDWLEGMVRAFEVVIFTTRGQYPEGRGAIREWLVKHGYRGPDLRITNKKLAALAYLDDRAMRFAGAFPTKEEIHRALPWRAAA